MTEKTPAAGESRENTSFESVQKAISGVLDTVTATARTFFLLLLPRPRAPMPLLLDGGRQYAPPLAFLAVASFIFLIFAEAIAENLEQAFIGPGIFARALQSLRDASAFGLVIRALPVFLACVVATALARWSLARRGGQERMGRALHYAAGFQLVATSLMILLLFGYGPIYDEYGTEGEGFINRVNKAAEDLLFERKGLLYLLALTVLVLPALTLRRAVQPDLLRKFPRNPFGRLVSLPAACLLSFVLALSGAILPVLVGRRLGGDTRARMNFAAQGVRAERGKNTELKKVPRARVLKTGDKFALILSAAIRNNTGATIYLSRAYPELQWKRASQEHDAPVDKQPMRVEKWADGDSPVLAVRPGEVKWLTVRADKVAPSDVESLKRISVANPDKYVFRLRLFEFYYDPKNAGIDPPEFLADWAALEFEDDPGPEAAPTPTPTPTPTPSGTKSGGGRAR